MKADGDLVWGKGPVIDVEQTPLGPFEKQAFALLHGLIQQAYGVLDVRPHLFGVAEVFSTQRVGIELFRGCRGCRDYLILAGDDHAQPLAQVLGVQQFADADAVGA